MLCLGDDTITNEAQKLLTGGESVKTWRTQVIEFIREQSGSYIDKKWQLDYFEEFKMVGINEEEENSPDKKIKNPGDTQNQPKKTLKDVEKVILYNRSQFKNQTTEQKEKQ